MNKPVIRAVFSESVNLFTRLSTEDGDVSFHADIGDSS